VIVCDVCGNPNPVDARFCMSCGARLAQPVGERRQLATMLFCDLSGSTALGERLDPESVREIVLQYFHAMRSVIERHGGTVAKFIGDAVMAVFGAPVVHEDDAFRAVRAAWEMRGRLEELNDDLHQQYRVRLSVHIGVYSGEVVAAGAVGGEAFVTGDAVNVAARLEQLAAPGEIVIGELTRRLLDELVEVEPVGPLAAKGKAEPVPAFRLRSVAGVGVMRRSSSTQLVGRDEELAALRGVLKDVVDARRPRLILIAGEAGIGKSRIAREFARGAEADLLYGRCLPYGDGITYWPLAEVVKAAAGVTQVDSAALAVHRIKAAIRADERAGDVTRTLAQALALSGGGATPEDIAWAARRFFATLARDRPIIVCLDDLQWAEPVFLDLVESLAATRDRVQLMVLVLARDELLERRPHWQTLRITPLRGPDAARLVETLAALDETTRDRVITQAGGNPFFVEELVAAAVDAPAVALPPTLDALLAARLDRLGAKERAVLEPGAVEGEVFHRKAVETLIDKLPASEISAAVSSLAAADLLRSVDSLFPNDDAFRFRNLLLRDAAYRSILKRRRARLHERLADWLEGLLGERVLEYEEVVGYHLEQAHRSLAELGEQDEQTLRIGERGAARLASAGHRALARADMPAAAALLRRATSLLRPGVRQRVELLPELARACRFAGDSGGAEQALTAAREEAAALGEPGLRARAEVETAFVRLYTDRQVDAEEVIALADRTVPLFEDLADDSGLVQVWALIGHANWLLCRAAAMEEAFARALERARNDAPERGWLLRMLAVVYFAGPMPVSEAIERCEEILRLGSGHGEIEVSTRAKIAGLEAMRGDFERARKLYRRSKQVGDEFGLRLHVAAVANYSGPIELLAGDPERAEHELRLACGVFEELGETGTLATSAAILARVLDVRGELDEAMRWTEVSEASAPGSDLAPQFMWRSVRAKLLARRGAFDTALVLGKEAVALAGRSDFSGYRGETLLDLAELLELTGDLRGAGTAATEAQALFAAKGNQVLADFARLTVARLRS
jgi:class 3 adenylate cyclase/tetratricopeptide (TPR) repeat protein